MATKYESYFNQIKTSAEKIKTANDYKNVSKAFGHWFLETNLNLSEQEIGECLIDGSYDNGVDAIIYNESSEELTILQFKFPSSATGIIACIGQDSIMKTIRGFEILVGRKKSKAAANKQFLDFKKLLKDKQIFKFNIRIVSFNKGMGDNAAILEEFKESFVSDTGSDFNYEDVNVAAISNIFERQNRTTSIKVSLKYTLLQPAYSIDNENINSYIGVINAKKLVSAIRDKMSIIFDENIRLYENDSKINISIRQTASSSDSNMFYFYNNGVVFICDSAEISPNTLTVRLNGASIVNGCQTVNVLADLEREDKLNGDVCLLIRIIQISSYDQRSMITEYLNSQTPIKDSYFISNHTVVRELQKALQPNGYFLERQINEKLYKTTHGETISDDLKVIQLEKAIQYYTGYWLDKFVALAKRGKGSLFDKDRIEEILQDITAEKIIESYELYQKISRVLTMYRKFTRNETNTDFSIFLGVDLDLLKRDAPSYLFVNSGDILILNTVKKLKSIDVNKTSDDELIKQAIIICRDVIRAYSNDGSSEPISYITKNMPVFSAVSNHLGLNE